MKCVGVFLKEEGPGVSILQKVSCHSKERIGKPLKCLHNDNGGEYTSHEFKNYYFEHGIRHEKMFLAPYSIMVWPKKSTEPLWTKSDVC